MECTAIFLEIKYYYLLLITYLPLPLPLLTLPTRVKEKQYGRDGQGRDAVPLLASEGRMIIRKLLEGAHEVQKIIKFQKQQGKGQPPESK